MGSTLSQMFTTSTIQKCAGVLGATGVIAGAVGAHALPRFMKDPTKVDTYVKVFQTGSQYHLLHAVALLAVPTLIKRPHIVAPLLIGGTCLFSGSCYIAALMQDRAYSRLAPYGGIMLILGWLAMALP